MTRQTSIEAYNYIRENGLLSKMRFKVYDYVFRNGPCTIMETNLALNKGGVWNGTCTARFSELKRLGVIVEVGKKVCPHTNRNVLIWDTTTNLPKELPKRITTKEKFAIIKNHLYAMKNLTHHGIDEEEWRIDEMLEAIES